MFYYTIPEKDSLNAKKQKKVYRDTLFDSAYDSTGKATLENGNGYYKKYNDDFKTVAEEGSVKNYKRDGKWQGYSSEYGLTFSEEYTNGKLVLGSSTDSMGGKYSYKIRIKPAVYTDGQDKMYQFLGEHMRYPITAIRNGLQGVTIVHFKIGRDGKPFSYQPIGTADAELKAEAVRVVKLLQNWYPSENYGKKMDEALTLPITFSLQNPFNNKKFIYPTTIFIFSASQWITLFSK